MAKQNKDQSFADETQQNEKTKESIQKEMENKKEKKQKKKQEKEQKKKQGKNQEQKYGKKINRNGPIGMLPVVIAVIDIFYALAIFFWSKKIGKSSVYLDFVADRMLDVAMLVIEVLLLMGTVFFILKGKNKVACVTASVIMGVILYGLFAVNLKVVASINADKEKPVVESTKISENLLDYIQNQVVYQLRKYSLEEDLFLENLEQYCGIPDNNISQEERLGKMADIIFSYLKNNITETSEKQLPYNYETNVLMGNVVYDKFSDLIEESKKKENVSIKNRICDYALKTLDEAITCRIEADNSLQTPENRRLIGVYNIDAGVCYQSIGEIGSAAECYENAAEWAVKSIYSAAIENNVMAMEKAWNVLNNAADKLEEVEGSSDGDGVQKVKNIRDAYKIVIDQWKE